MWSVQPSRIVIQTHLLFLQLGFCLCYIGTGLQARGSCPWAYLTHCFYFCDMKMFSYYKTKLPSERKWHFPSFIPVIHCHLSLLFLSILSKHCQNQDAGDVLQEEWSLSYRSTTFWKGFFNVSYYTNRKISCHRLRNEKGRTGDISSSEIRPFLFQPLKRFRKAGVYKKLFRVITASPVSFKGEVKSRLRKIKCSNTFVLPFLT